MTELRSQKALNAETARLAAIDSAEAATLVLANAAFADVYAKKAAVDTAVTAVGTAITNEAASQVTLGNAASALATTKTNVSTCRTTLANADDAGSDAAIADLAAKVALQRTAQTTWDTAFTATTAGKERDLSKAIRDFNTAQAVGEGYIKK